jgi:plastocyanin
MNRPASPARLSIRSLVTGLLTFASSACFADAATGVVTGTIALEPMKPVPPDPSYVIKTKRPIEDPDAPRAIVYLVRDDGVYPAREKKSTAALAMVQHGYQFRPAIAAVRAGDRVAFPNEDDEFHNVFSYSPAKRFDLGRYRKGEQSPLIAFETPGLVKIYCEIHKHMRAMLLVLDTPWFTATDADGRFELAAPTGDYAIRAFLPSEQMLESRIAVRASATTRIDLNASARSATRPGA